MKTRLLSFEEVSALPEGTIVYHKNRFCNGEIREMRFGVGYPITEEKALVAVGTSTSYQGITRLDRYERIEGKTYEWIDDSKVLTGDKIRTLPHATKIKFMDNYDRGDGSVVHDGIINQIESFIGGDEGRIGSCRWNFTSLESKEVKAWVVEEVSFASIMEKIEKETPIKEYIKEYNLVEMVEEMNTTKGVFEDLPYHTKYALIGGQLKYLACYNKEWKEVENISLAFMLRKFVKVKEESNPVDFMTALKSGKKVNVKHTFISDYTGSLLSDNQAKFRLEMIKEGEYLEVSETLITLGKLFIDKDLKEVISHGKWYIEGDK